jgi:hydroxylamine reductase
MFCHQCEQTAGGKACTNVGVCGKDQDIQGLQDDLPLSPVVSWYEQKAVVILPTLLYLGIKNIRPGPTMPAFLSPNVPALPASKYNIKSIGTIDDDMALMLK